MPALNHRLQFGSTPARSASEGLAGASGWCSRFAHGHIAQGGARRAFTVMESIVAIALLLVVAGLLAELGMMTLAERQRNSGRQQAQEIAMNVLEAARAGAWETLTPEWAKAQRLPEALAADLEKAELVVQVEPEPARPHTKRITVEIRWQQDGKPVRPVKLVSLLSARSAARPGGKP